MNRRSSRILSYVCAFFLFEVSLCSAQGPHSLGPLDGFDLVYAESPQIAPDGKKIVYVLHSNDIMRDVRQSGLYLLDEGQEPRALASSSSHDYAPVWSADSQRIYFLSNGQICLYDLEQEQIHCLTELSQPALHFELSPDGQWLAFVALVPERLPFQPALPEPPDGATWADPFMAFDTLKVSQDGQGYWQRGHLQLFLLPASGGQPIQLTEGDCDYQRRGIFPSPFCWTADSRALVCVCNDSSDPEQNPLASELYLVRIDDGSMYQLTDMHGSVNWPSCSPDGEWIAFTANGNERKPHHVDKLYVMHTDGSAVRCLSADFDRSLHRIQWSADASQVYVQYDDEGNTKLGSITLSGKRAELARDLGTLGLAYGGAYFGGKKYSVAPDGQIVTVRTLPHLPSDLFLSRAGVSPRRLTRLNDALLQDLELGEVEEIRFTSSFDGRPIHGWILKPPGFDPHQKYPLILEIHGGPIANYGARFDFEKQLFASRGYVVLYCNPRGSTSYGDALGNAIHHDYPGHDLDDLLSGVDAVIARGYVDEKRLFITGGSGGGVLTCWAVGHTGRFAAAAARFPIVNWVSALLDGDITAYQLYYWFPAPPWEDFEHYWARSPLSLVGQVTTPTLLLCGDEDRRTPFSESAQFYAALKVRGVDSLLVRFPGESHGCMASPSHAMSQPLIIVDWFDRYQAAD